MTHILVSLIAGNDVASTSCRHCFRRQLGIFLYRSAMLIVILCMLITKRVTATTAVGTFLPHNCVKCAGLKYCTMMNGQYMFEPIAGYSRESSTQLEKQGVCEDLDAKTFALSAFGSQVQYKDTAVCHKLVWNFHCLSWVATTFKRSVNGTPVSCATTDGSVTIPLPPCRSLCVEVADKCVYSHLYRMYLDEVCGNIGCLTETEEAKINGARGFNTAETTCVSGKWVYEENKTFSRCSIRSYEPPASAAAHDAIYTGVAAISLSCVLWLVYY